MLYSIGAVDRTNCLAKNIFCMSLIFHQTVTSVPMHIRKIHQEQLLSSVLFNNTVFLLNSSHTVCVSLCTTHLRQLYSVAFLSASEAIMLNPIQKIENSALTRKSHKTNEQKMHKCKVKLDKHTSFL